MDKPIINFGEEYVDFLTKEVIIKYLKKHNINHVINAFLYSIFGEDDMPQLKTVKMKEEDKGKNIDDIDTLLVFINGEWTEVNSTFISLEVCKKMYELIIFRLTPKPDDLSFEKYQELLKCYSDFLINYENFLKTYNP
jgi:hypothetical protein